MNMKAKERRLWVLKGSVAAVFLRLRGIKNPANRPIYDMGYSENAPCRVMRGGSVGLSACSS